MGCAFSSVTERPGAQPIETVCTFPPPWRTHIPEAAGQRWWGSPAPDTSLCLVYGCTWLWGNFSLLSHGLGHFRKQVLFYERLFFFSTNLLTNDVRVKVSVAGRQKKAKRDLWRRKVVHKIQRGFTPRRLQVLKQTDWRLCLFFFYHHVNMPLEPFTGTRKVHRVVPLNQFNKPNI